MIIRMLAILGALVFAGMTTGCAPVRSPAMGAFWMDVQGPIMSNGKIGAKEGRACAKSWFGVYAAGDASIKAAAAAGGISRIDSVDHHSTVKVVVGEFCTIVRGS